MHVSFLSSNSELYLNSISETMEGENGIKGDKNSREPINQCAVCQSVAEHRCTGCRQVSYCTREHQKMDWKTHKQACKPYEIKNTRILGRHLVATRDLSPGEIIFTELPLAWGPKSMSDPEHYAPCVGCYRPVSLDFGERCASCGWPVCMGNCPGLLDRRNHGLECPVLTLRPGCAVSYLGDYYRHDALLPLRCLLAQKKYQKKFMKITDLQSHVEDRTPETEVFQLADANIVKYLQDNFLHALKSVETELNTNIAPDISNELLHKLCGIIDVNALEIKLNEGTEVLALYTQFCLMEHSCFPNTKHSFDIKHSDENTQFKVTVKAVLPIKAGEHVTTMYSHALWGTQSRREHLKELKYFDCNCVRCRDPTEMGTYLSALRCLGTGKHPCGGIQLPKDPCGKDIEWCCDTCDVKIRNNEISYLIQQMGDEVETIQANGPTVKLLEDLKNKLSNFLHPHHYHLYSVKHSLVQLYGHQQGYLLHQLTEEMLKKKTEMCQELIDITTKVDPGNSRLSLYTGVLYHELFLSEFTLLKKHKDTIEPKDMLQQIEPVKKYLKCAKNVLQDECEGSIGWKMSEVFKESERGLKMWLQKL